jgi:hypothetical protein
MYTNSEITCFRECPRKHEYKYLQCIKPVNMSPACSWGVRWHKLLESIYLGDTIHPDDDLLPYFKGYKVVKGQTIWVEKELRQNIGEFTFGGKLDLVQRIDGQMWIVEHKTTSADISPGGSYIQGAQYWSQLTLYRMLLPEACGVILDVVRKGKTPKYAQVEIHHTQKELDDAKENLLAWARKMRYGLVYPRNTDSCFKWGGPCEYLPLCSGECSREDVRYRQGRRHEELANDY